MSVALIIMLVVAVLAVILAVWDVLEAIADRVRSRPPRRWAA